MNAYVKVAFIAWLRQWVVKIEAHWADGVKKTHWNAPTRQSLKLLSLVLNTDWIK